ncbi:C40 family peptidase [Paenibacillus alkalitolerans]|uniref:C40 family peptidase n=1 Tax=Paenibacillus alkalitolerans TaxID=2799335 RepID=UPI003898E511
MKKASIALLAAGIAFGSMAGTAMAATTLERTVDSVIGVDYRWGGTTTDGFDCSGFTSYIFKKLGVDLPHQSKAQAKMGVKVGRDELRPGDLVFFNTSGSGISHVGIYMGNDEIAHSSSKHGVRISSMSDSYYTKRYVTARRILGSEAYAKFATEAPKVVESAKEAAAAKEKAPAPVVVTVTNPADPVASATEEAELAAEEAQENAVQEETAPLAE